jgi:hypothetical protein
VYEPISDLAVDSATFCIKNTCRHRFRCPVQPDKNMDTGVCNIQSKWSPKIEQNSEVSGKENIKQNTDTALIFSKSSMGGGP